MTLFDWLKRLAAENVEYDDYTNPREAAEQNVEAGNAEQMTKRLEGEREVTERPDRTPKK